MPDMNAKSEVKSITWEAVVIRKDGTVEDHGVITEWHRSPLKRLMRRLRSGKR